MLGRRHNIESKLHKESAKLILRASWKLDWEFGHPFPVGRRFNGMGRRPMLPGMHLGDGTWHWRRWRVLFLSMVNYLGAGAGLSWTHMDETIGRVHEEE